MAKIPQIWFKKTNRRYKTTTYKCDCAIDCEASFGTFNSFQSHCLEKHRMFPLECKICKRRYKEQATFKNHLETHQGVLKYECDNCSKKFVTKERLFAHRRLHLPGKTLPCSQYEEPDLNKSQKGRPKTPTASKVIPFGSRIT